MSETGTVNIRGKDYKTVALRVNEFRDKFPDYSIENDVISSETRVVVKTTIKTPDGRVISTGYAEEERDSTNINKTSALENCETSAVGRALAFLGFGGSEIASANEISDAIIKQTKKDAIEYFSSYMSYVRDNLDLVVMVVSASAYKDVEGMEEEYAAASSDAAGMWYDLSEDAQMKLYGLAPTKGGIFTTEQRKLIKEELPSIYKSMKGVDSNE
jgi:hypothetical protein